ncbi:MAG: flagellar basal body rod protein FlgF [Proteobacteria bacterium]|nr:MAG: flagellar basal body rod protein FlgF [Pseudomonadota bacterium]
MDRMIYLAMSAAKQMLTAQAVSAHNLANASTVGFKADYDTFRAMPVFGPGHPTRAFAMVERSGINSQPGSFETTANNLDIAVNGDGFIAVQSPDGSEAYTRAGDLKITVSGQLKTGAGHAVLGNGGPIALPQSESILIGTDGTISIRPIGQESTTLADVDRIKLVAPDFADLVKGEDGLFRLRDGSQAPPDSSVTVTSGVLERSNVNVVSEMIAMIEHARQYEMAIKAMRSAQENDAAGARILRIA